MSAQYDDVAELDPAEDLLQEWLEQCPVQLRFGDSRERIARIVRSETNMHALVSTLRAPA